MSRSGEVSRSGRPPECAQPSEGFSGRGMPLGQRARSCETPSSNRPRVGPPRSPASSSGAPRSRTVGDVRCSRTSSRSACCTRREHPVTPQAERIHCGLTGRFEHRGNRPAATVCGYYGTVPRYERRPHACRDQRFRSFLKDLQGSFHRRIIHVYLSSTISMLPSLVYSGLNLTNVWSRVLPRAAIPSASVKRVPSQVPYTTDPRI